MIDTESIIQITAAVALLWSLGYSAGKAVAWVRAIRSAA